MGAEISTVDHDTHRADACEMLTGTYTGNGADDRIIGIGVNLAAKSNVIVIVKATSNDQATFRIEYAQGDLSGHFTADVHGADRIQAFTAGGFEIGTRQEVNTNEQLYNYIAFWTEP